MKNKLMLISLLACLGLLLISCSGDGSNPPDDSLEKKATIAAINVNDETQDADILVLSTNDSYMLCDVNKDNKCGLVYINNSVENEIEEGLTIILDSTGVPMMVQCKDGEILFENVTETSCDLAFRDKDGKITYFWDVQMPGDNNPNDIVRRMPAASSNPFSRWWSSVSSFDWTWDEYQRKAIIPYLAKVGAFTLTAFDAVFGTATGKFNAAWLLCVEMKKSDLIYFSDELEHFVQSVLTGKTAYDSGKLLKNGKLHLAAKTTGLAVLAQMLNEYGDRGLANLSNFKEETRDIYSEKEFQIILSTNFLECDPAEKTYTVDVTTKSYWSIDFAPKDWCSVEKSGNQIVVHVSAYDGTEDRVCNAVIKTPSVRIPTATLTIRQTGVVFSLSVTELTFVGKQSSRGVYVNTNSNVRRWEVASYPSWLILKKTDIGTNSFFLDVDPNQYDGTIKTGVVTVDAYMANATNPISKTIQVTWKPQPTWDNTKWKFSGNVTTSGFGESATSYGEFYLNVNSVANNDFSWIFGSVNIGENISVNEAGQLNVNGAYTMDGSTARWSMTVTRTSETTATCDFRGGSDLVSQHGTLSGVLIE